jgi:hypothetical protein
MAHSRNKAYLDADTLLLNLTQQLDQNLEKGTGRGMLGEIKK